MQWKLDHSECTDLSTCERTPEGWYIMTESPRVDGTMDYCDAKAEEWIWIIGSIPMRMPAAGELRYLAGNYRAIGPLHELPGFKAVWLR